jgi:membrane protease YdiL (CAAX protease family)
LTSSYATSAVLVALVRKEESMTTIQTFIQRHAVLIFYALTFAISWGGILTLVAPGGIPGTNEQVERLMPFVVLVMFAGPSIAGVLMTGLVAGRAGLRELLSRLLRWRVGARWYMMALLFAPLLVTAVLLALSLLSPEFLPGIVTTENRVALLLFGIAWGLIGGGFLEELGWTGFAVPRLRLRYGVVTTGIFVGLLWGAWHFLVAFWASSSLSGEDSLAMFMAGTLAFYVGALPAYRVLMVWVYDRTGSLLVAMLMHASLSASTLILQPLAMGVPYFIWNLVLAAMLWIVVAVVATANRGHLSRPPLYREINVASG